MQLCHTVSATSAVFDDPNLVSCAGLVPVLGLAARCGLGKSVGTALTVPSQNAAAKLTTLVAGMVAGADSIDDMDLLRHGGMGRVFDEVPAPSTLCSFLRSFRFGHVRQLDQVAAGLLVKLATHTPLLRDADQMVLVDVDVDDTVKATYGYAKQGAGYGYSGGERFERADRDRVDGHLGTGDRCDPAPERIDPFGAGRGPADRRHPRHHATLPVGRGDGAGVDPGRLGFLQRRCSRRDQSWRVPVLHHRPDGQGGASRYRHHRRHHLDSDPISERDLRRHRATLDL